MPKYLHIQQHCCDNIKYRSDPNRSVADGSKFFKLFVVLLSVFTECWDDMPEIQGHYFIRKLFVATSCWHVYLVHVSNSADHYTRGRAAALRDTKYLLDKIWTLYSKFIFSKSVCTQKNSNISSEYLTLNSTAVENVSLNDLRYNSSKTC
jgi:hypothetical protein